MKKEFKRIRKISKKIIGRKQYKNIKKISSYVDKTEGLKYAVASKLKLNLLELELKSAKINKKETLKIKSNLDLIPYKIKIFESTYDKRDYKVIQKLIKETEKELENA